MYSNRIMEEFYNPENYGVIKGANGVGKITSDVGSEIIKIYIRVENGHIAEAMFQTFGGVVAIAATSLATKMMQGKSTADITKFTTNDLLKELGEVPENKMYIIQAVVNAMHASIANYENKSDK